MDEEQCPRCPNYLTVDEECGFLLCSSCGYVQDEVRLVHNSGPFDGGVNVGDDVAGSGGGALVAVGEAGYRPGTGLAAASTDRDRTTKRSLDKLRGVASTLGLAPGMVADAVSLFKEMRDRRLLHSGGGDNTMESQVAAVLFLTVRGQQQPLSLIEVAAACHANPKAAARHFSALMHSLSLPGFIPSASIRAFAMRISAKLLDTLNCGEGPRAQHPYVKECMAVAELVSKLGLGEGRQPAIIAAGCLLWVAETGLSKKHLPPRIHYPQAISTASSVSMVNVSHTRRTVAQSVLEVAQLLPMGSHLTESNLLHYFPVVASLVHTLAALRRTPASETPLLLECPPGAPSGSTPQLQGTQGDVSAAVGVGSSHAGPVGAGGLMGRGGSSGLDACGGALQPSQGVGHARAPVAGGHEQGEGQDPGPYVAGRGMQATDKDTRAHPGVSAAGVNGGGFSGDVAGQGNGRLCVLPFNDLGHTEGDKEGVRGSAEGNKSMVDGALSSSAPGTGVSGTRQGVLGEHETRKRAREGEGGEGPSEGKRARKGRFQGLPEYMKDMLRNPKKKK